MAELCKRIGTVNINGREFESPPFSFAFSLDFVSSYAPAQGELTIKNPSDETVQAAEKQGNEFPRCTITAGHENDSGLVFLGQITQSESKWEGVDKNLKLKLMDNANLWNFSTVSLSFSTPVRASQIIQAILAKVGVTGAQIRPANDKTFDTYAVNTTFRNAMIQLAKETGSDFFSRQGQIYFRSPTASDTAEAIVLQPEEIIGTIEKTDSGVKGKTLFNHRFAPGVFVDATEARRNPGIYRVQKCKMVWSDEGDANVEWEGRAA